MIGREAKMPNRKLRAAVTLTVAVWAIAAPGAVSAAAPTFAPAASATIHPGVMTHTDGAQCTSNFVFYDATTVYLGQAAHCSGTGSSDETNGCLAKSLPVGTPVEVAGASRPGRLAYNSWVTMQAGGETDANTCQYNDLALVAIDPADAAAVSPDVPTFGAPTGVNTTGVAAGEAVRSYGNSELRGGVAALSPKYGNSLGQDSNGWNHTVLTLTPGIPGDSGSGFLDAQGRAFGVLSTLSLLPVPGENGVGDLSRELAYLHAHGGPDVVLADTSRTSAPAAVKPAVTPTPRAAKKKQATTRRAHKKARCTTRSSRRPHCKPRVKAAKTKRAA